MRKAVWRFSASHRTPRRHGYIVALRRHGAFWSAVAECNGDTAFGNEGELGGSGRRWCISPDSRAYPLQSATPTRLRSLFVYIRAIRDSKPKARQHAPWVIVDAAPERGWRFRPFVFYKYVASTTQRSAASRHPSLQREDGYLVAL